MATTQHDLVLPAAPASVGQARRFVSSALAELGAGQTTEVAGLLASELVTNAVLHAGGTIRVRVSTGDGRVRIAVGDTSDSHPLPRRASDGDRSGRGLALVMHLAERWGVDDLDVGKEVWFELRV